MGQQHIIDLGSQLFLVINKVLMFLPNFIWALVIVLLGWIFGTILGRAVAHIFDILKLDHLFNALGLVHLSKRTGHEIGLGRAFGGLTKWTVIIAFFMAAANTLGLAYVSMFLMQLVNYLPNVFVAGFILVITSVLSGFTEKVIDGSVRSVGMKAGFAGTVAKYAIVFTGVLAALSQLNIVDVFANTLFIGIVAAVSLAFGLAFGLGGKNAAERAIEKIEDDFSKK
jgi:hypothetical protein